MLVKKRMRGDTKMLIPHHVQAVAKSRSLQSPQKKKQIQFFRAHCAQKTKKRQKKASPKREADTSCSKKEDGTYIRKKRRAD